VERLAVEGQSIPRDEYQGDQEPAHVNPTDRKQTPACFRLHLARRSDRRCQELRPVIPARRGSLGICETTMNHQKATVAPLLVMWSLRHRPDDHVPTSGICPIKLRCLFALFALSESLG